MGTGKDSMSPWAETAWALDNSKHCNTISFLQNIVQKMTGHTMALENLWTFVQGLLSVLAREEGKADLDSNIFPNDIGWISVVDCEDHGGEESIHFWKPHLKGRCGWSTIQEAGRLGFQATWMCLQSNVTSGRLQPSLNKLLDLLSVKRERGLKKTSLQGMSFCAHGIDSACS